MGRQRRPTPTRQRRGDVLIARFRGCPHPRTAAAVIIRSTDAHIVTARRPTPTRQRSGDVLIARFRGCPHPRTAAAVIIRSADAHIVTARPSTPTRQRGGRPRGRAGEGVCDLRCRGRLLAAQQPCIPAHKATALRAGVDARKIASTPLSQQRNQILKSHRAVSNEIRRARCADGTRSPCGKHDNQIVEVHQPARSSGPGRSCVGCAILQLSCSISFLVPTASVHLTAHAIDAATPSSAAAVHRCAKLSTKR